MKLQLAAGGLTVAVLCSGCATAPRYEAYVPPPLGSTWTYSQNNTGGYGSGRVQSTSRRGERTWQGQQVITFEGPESAFFADPASGRIYGAFKGDTPLVTWDPPMGYQFPLEVGKTWTTRYKATFHAANRVAPFEQTQTVEAYEDVTVPAGTFKAYRVRTKNSIGIDTTEWISPQLGIYVKTRNSRATGHPAGAGTRESELVSHTIRK